MQRVVDMYAQLVREKNNDNIESSSLNKKVGIHHIKQPDGVCGYWCWKDVGIW